MPERLARLPRRETLSVPEGEPFFLATDCETMLIEMLSISSPSLVAPSLIHAYITPGWRCANDNADFLRFVGPYAFIDRPGVYEFLITGVFSPALASTAIFDVAVTRGLSQSQWRSLSQSLGCHDAQFSNRVIPALTEVSLTDAQHPLFPRFREIIVHNLGDTNLDIRLTSTTGSAAPTLTVTTAVAGSVRVIDPMMLGRSTVTLFANDTLGNTNALVGVSLW